MIGVIVSLSPRTSQPRTTAINGIRKLEEATTVTSSSFRSQSQRFWAIALPNTARYSNINAYDNESGSDGPSIRRAIGVTTIIVIAC